MSALIFTYGRQVPATPGIIGSEATGGALANTFAADATSPAFPPAGFTPMRASGIFLFIDVAWDIPSVSAGGSSPPPNIAVSGTATVSVKKGAALVLQSSFDFAGDIAPVYNEVGYWSYPGIPTGGTGTGPNQGSGALTSSATPELEIVGPSSAANAPTGFPSFPVRMGSVAARYRAPLPEGSTIEIDSSGTPDGSGVSFNAGAVYYLSDAPAGDLTARVPTYAPELQTPLWGAAIAPHGGLALKNSPGSSSTILDAGADPQIDLWIWEGTLADGHFEHMETQARSTERLYRFENYGPKTVFVVRTFENGSHATIKHVFSEKITPWGAAWCNPGRAVTALRQAGSVQRTRLDGDAITHSAPGLFAFSIRAIRGARGQALCLCLSKSPFLDGPEGWYARRSNNYARGFGLTASIMSSIIWDITHTFPDLEMTPWGAVSIALRPQTTEGGVLRELVCKTTANINNWPGTTVVIASNLTAAPWRIVARGAEILVTNCYDLWYRSKDSGKTWTALP